MAFIRGAAFEPGVCASAALVNKSAVVQIATIGQSQRLASTVRGTPSMESIIAGRGCTREAISRIPPSLRGLSTVARASLLHVGRVKNRSAGGLLCSDRPVARCSWNFATRQGEKSEVCAIGSEEEGNGNREQEDSVGLRRAGAPEPDLPLRHPLSLKH